MTAAHLPWALARAQSYDAAAPAAGRPLALERCAGTTLAAALVARTDLPPADTSAMDGYAVAGAGPWELVGEVLAGTFWPVRLEPGRAVTIGTGAPTPAGTTAVLQVENAQVQDGVVHGEVRSGRHVRCAGEECRTGDVLLPAGTAVTASVIALAAATGHDVLQVVARPRVVALVTGDELLSQGLPRDGRVRDALGPALPLLVGAHGGDLTGHTHLPDDADLLRKAIEAADADVVLTTGASSVGPADHLHSVVADLGGTFVVDGVACRPGHPQLLARLPDGRFVAGLPGNPLAALVAAQTVLAPVLAGLSGRPLRTGAALLAEPVPSWSGGTRLVPVALDGLRARVVPHTGAGMLRGAALADALAVVPPGPDLPAGGEVEVLPLP